MLTYAEYNSKQFYRRRDAREGGHQGGAQISDNIREKIRWIPTRSQSLKQIGEDSGWNLDRGPGGTYKVQSTLESDL